MAKSRPQHPLVVKATTAATMLDVSRAHVYKLMERGELRRIQIPGSRAVRIPTEDVYALLGMDAPASGGAA